MQFPDTSYESNSTTNNQTTGRIPGKMEGGNTERAQAAKKLDDKMKTIGGTGLKLAAALTLLLKTPLVTRPALYRSTFATMLGKSKDINSSSKVNIASARMNIKNSVTQAEFNEFRNFPGILVKPGETLNKWSLQKIKDKDPELYEAIRKKPTDEFSEQEIQKVDQIHFEAIQRHLELAAKVGNADQNPAANHELREAHVAETLAKSLAYLDNIDKNQLSVPVWNATAAKWETKPYEVNTKAIGDNLPIHILKPQDTGPEFIVVRGTELRASRAGALESLFADVDAKGIGHTVVEYELERETSALRNELSEARMHDRKVVLVGHSLGGAIVNNLAIRDIAANGKPTHIHKAYGFSAPGVGNEEAKMAKRKDIHKAVKNTIHNYQTAGDVVPNVWNSVGTNYEVGKRGAKGHIKEAKLNAIDAHFSMGLNHAGTVTKISMLDELVSVPARLFSTHLFLPGPRKILFDMGQDHEALPSYYIKP